MRVSRAILGQLLVNCFACLLARAIPEALQTSSNKSPHGAASKPCCKRDPTHDFQHVPILTYFHNTTETDVDGAILWKYQEAVQFNGSSNSIRTS